MLGPFGPSELGNHTMPKRPILALKRNVRWWRYLSQRTLHDLHGSGRAVDPLLLHVGPQTKSGLTSFFRLPPVSKLHEFEVFDRPHLLNVPSVGANRRSQPLSELLCRPHPM